MGIKIACIPADNSGNKLWLKELRINEKRLYLKYRTTYNDIPFTETEIFPVDGGNNFAITGTDGTVLYRFSINWLKGLEIS